MVTTEIRLRRSYKHHMGFVGENQEVKKMVFEETVAALEFGVCLGRFSLTLFVCLLWRVSEYPPCFLIKANLRLLDPS